ncbi:MAG: 2-succinyl-5-enolpyruvyl-6-hydroxy-3-cyclohexene-1-carboxylic-acid synthase [Verrucomicrobiota bacterium]
MTDSESWPTRLIETFRCCGIREFAYGLGSRNAPLLHALFGVRGFSGWSFVDERSAGFFALGRARASGRPVALVTTSGTAVAELLPALVEATYQALPLLAVTADRPKRFRGSGAPQAIEQAAIFGEYVEGVSDVAEGERWDLSAWSRRSPWQLNLCLEEPSFGEGRAAEALPEESGPPAGGLDEAAAVLSRFCNEYEEGLQVVVGDLKPWERSAVADFVHRLGAPVWAEGSSTLREVSGLRSQLLVGGEPELQGRRFLRLGGVPSGRFWRDLEGAPQLEVLSVSAMPFSGLARESTFLRAPLEDLLPKTGVRPHPRAVERLRRDAGRFRRLEKALATFPGSEPGLVARLSQVIPPEATVFLGNSLPIREWTLAATRRDKRWDLHASRGANGIDGQLATFFGVAAEVEEAWALVGDLTALYDLNAPLILESMKRRPRLRIVVVNNGGGRIFGRLPAMQALAKKDLAKLEGRRDFPFSKWASLWRWKHLRVEGSEPVPSDLPEGGWLLELIPEDAQTEAFWEAIR